MTNPWMIVWTGVFLVSVGLFALLALVVSIGGARDLAAMFRRLDQQHESSDSEEQQLPEDPSAS